ncbi:SDR family NAD(P)-dependent oxidoreductase [Candidatus Woesearchaeota archaeon]|nr:MAG: SDR family NAD(P)-dependent oxidoreductase [Candidatus Woesearchaeota archaeon]
MGETILVTGGAGFIGSHVCDRLLSIGKRVICLDNLNSYYPTKIKIRNIQHNLDNPNYSFLNIDITHKDQLEQVFQNNKISRIIHLAARAGVRSSIEKPLLYEDTNIKGTLNLLELSKKYSIKNFIFGSSSSVYGNSTKVPFSEEDKVEKPISPYAASKKACELYCYTYSHLYKINVTCLRFFTVYGPRGRPDMAPYLFTKWINEGKPIKMFGDGTTRRDYTFITDVVDGIIAALNKPFKYEIINLGNSNTIKLRDFISIIEKHLGKKAKIRRYPIQPGDVKITYADISKAKSLLGFKPKVSVEEGMRRFIEWYKNYY